MNIVKPFPKVITMGPRLVGEGHPVLFIAEIGANFDNNLDKAKQLAFAAKKAGADVAKFQTFKADKIVSSIGFSRMKLKGVHGSWGRPVEAVFKEAEFPRTWHKKLADYCKEIGIMFSSAAYDYEGVDLLDSLNVPFIKIGSGDITWHEMLEYIAKKNKPMILATGASTLAEVDEAVRVIRGTGNNKLALLQCITNYPSKVSSANINVLKTYQLAFGTMVGYSDHSPGDTVVLGSVALGAKIIEKHFTLDKTAVGPDHPHSMNPTEFKEMIKRVRLLEGALGSMTKEVVDEESETVIVQRRSLYINRPISKGSKLSKNDLIELRPALGILPNMKKHILSMKVNKNLKKGEPLYWGDLE